MKKLASTYRHVSILLLIIFIELIFVKGESNEKESGPCKPETNTEKTSNNFNNFIQDITSIKGREVHCIGGFANQYPCKHVVLQSFVSNDELNDGIFVEANDIWGWTSPKGREYALVGLKSGTSFVDISDPLNPIVLGILLTHTHSNTWRDIKTYKDHAFIVSEANGHGLQIFDLTQLPSANVSSFTEFSPTSHYEGFGSAHNIFINEESGYAYVTGSKTCESGLHMINLKDPINPIFGGCFPDQGYTHDVQCVIYSGPDLEYHGKEVCFASNENKVDIIDVTNKTHPKLMSTFTYDGSSYTHQGWLTEDQRYFLIDDEGDEYFDVSNKTTTIVCDVSDLQKPSLKTVYKSSTGAIDHNQYVKGKYVYQANYRAGLRILKIDYESSDILTEVAYFDTYPSSNNNIFNGAWSNYPFFSSGSVIISDIEQGLFIVRPLFNSIESSDTTSHKTKITTNPSIPPTILFSSEEPSSSNSTPPTIALINKNNQVTSTLLPSIAPTTEKLIPTEAPSEEIIISEAPTTKKPTLIPSLSSSTNPTIYTSRAPSYIPSDTPTFSPSTLIFLSDVRSIETICRGQWNTSIIATVSDGTGVPAADVLLEAIIDNINHNKFSGNNIVSNIGNRIGNNIFGNITGNSNDNEEEVSPKVHSCLTDESGSGIFEINNIRKDMLNFRIINISKKGYVYIGNIEKLYDKDIGTSHTNLKDTEKDEDFVSTSITIKRPVKENRILSMVFSMLRLDG